RDVHSPARDEVLDPADKLGRADAEVWAAVGHLALGALKRCVAGRAAFGHAPGLLAAVAPVHDRADDIGDDIAGAFDRDIIADPDVALADVVGVVQAGVAHND